MVKSILSERRTGAASRPWRFVALVALLMLPAATRVVADESPQLRWQGIERVIAFADVHGAYTELAALLRQAGVVDAQLRWSAGKAHVVSLGDLLDRGADSRKVMDLLIRLQQEAAAAGGRLHVVLGNHEAMNVLGDLRYVDPGEYAAYSADEDPALRQRQRAQFLARHPDMSEADFDRAFPPGYFGHRALLGPEGRYGQWLLAMPAAIVINDTAYMHAGPSPVLQGRSLEALDRDYRKAVSDYVLAEAALRQAALLHFEDDFGRRAQRAAERLQALPPAPERQSLEALVAQFKDADDHPLLGPDGPNWYRGTAFCRECAEADVVGPYLQQTGVSRLVIGHTVARLGTVVSRFDGRVVKLDAGMNRAVYGGRPAALVSDASGSRVVYADPATAATEVPREPQYLSSQTMAEDVVEDLLARGQVATRDTCAPGVQDVRVTLDGRGVNAVFETASPERIRHEIAAYRLDRLLGLGLVPATVEREHEGRRGLLQGRPASWVSERDRQNARSSVVAGLACQTITAVPQAEPARRPVPKDGKAARMPSGGWCDLRAEYQLAYAFDALIDNRGRTLDGYLYDVESATLFLSGHGTAFSTSGDVPAPLRAEIAKTGAEMRRRLQALDAERAGAALEGLLGEREIRALLQRRDRVLELSSQAGSAEPTPSRP